MSRSSSKTRSPAAPPALPTHAGKPRATETRVFRSGNSDAVRIPTRYNLRGVRVRVRGLADGRLIVEPIRKRPWPTGFLESFGRGAEGLEAPPRNAPDASREGSLDTLFDDA